MADLCGRTALREGFTTGSCAAAAALASLLWQRDGVCPQQVEIITPAGRHFRPEILPLEGYCCAVRKDSGDDPDCTNGCLVTGLVERRTKPGIFFLAGAGVGTVTRPGLSIPVGEPAINPVPRQMITEAILPHLDGQGAVVTIGIENGAQLAEKTMNPRLGIVGGLSVLGTTGIVRPMSEAAVLQTIALELHMCRVNTGALCAVTTGYAGENYLHKIYRNNTGGICLCSNYLGEVLDLAIKEGFQGLILVGRPGKLIKPAAGIFHLHSHVAGGQREIVCTHAALCGAPLPLIRELFQANTTAQMQEILAAHDYHIVWTNIAQTAAEQCTDRTHGQVQVEVLLIDADNRPLAESQGADALLTRWQQTNKRHTE